MPPTLPGLFRVFLRLGATAFGGPAMIPHIRTMAVDRNGWLEDSDFRTGLALCQAIPGATAAQMAGYVGLRTRGLRGALAAFVAFTLPAVLLITLLSALYFRFQNLPRLLEIFAGLKILVITIVASAALDFTARYAAERIDRVLALGAALAFAAGMHPVPVLMAVVLAGLGLLPRPVAITLQPVRKGGFPAAVTLLTVCALGYGLLWAISPELAHIARVMMGIDLVAFGGGFAALPVMLHEIVVRLGWMPQHVFMDGIALGQLTPGPIVLTSAFVGFARAGLAGAAVAAVGIFTPSLLFLTWVVPVGDRLLGNVLFQKALRASLASLAGLMTAVMAGMAVSQTWTLPGSVLCLTAFAALRMHVDVLWVVAGGSALWLLLQLG